MEPKRLIDARGKAPGVPQEARSPTDGPEAGSEAIGPPGGNPGDARRLDVTWLASECKRLESLLETERLRAAQMHRALELASVYVRAAMKNGSTEAGKVADDVAAALVEGGPTRFRAVWLALREGVEAIRCELSAVVGDVLSGRYESPLTVDVLQRSLARRLQQIVAKLEAVLREDRGPAWHILADMAAVKEALKRSGFDPTTPGVSVGLLADAYANRRR